MLYYLYSSFVILCFNPDIHDRLLRVIKESERCLLIDWLVFLPFRQRQTLALSFHCDASRNVVKHIYGTLPIEDNEDCFEVERLAFRHHCLNPFEVLIFLSRTTATKMPSVIK